MAEVGHFKQIRPLISGLSQLGLAVYVFTHRLFAPEIERAGGTLVDLFGKYPLERVDDESLPFPCRYVTYAAAYVEEVLEELKRIQPGVILYETFSVIGRLAGQLLGIPFVNVSTGHNVDPARYLPILRADPRVAVAESCHRAVSTLRERYSLSDASPFSYVTGLSPYLNIYGQPPAFLTEDERRVFEPVAFYGCICSSDLSKRSQGEAPRYFAGTIGLRIYACLGTTAGRYYANTALSVFQAVSECVEGMPEARALISLGGARLDEKLLRQLKRPNVEVVEHADQWSVLQEADVFLTHHGLNSTHEAIIHGVPMISYPLFWDQPTLAKKCREFGIAIPTVESPRAQVTAEHINAALGLVLEGADSLHSNLDRVRGWEQEVIAQRDSVLQRILDLGLREPHARS